MTTHTITDTSSIATLNDLLQGERSAVATYEKAQKHLAGKHAVEIEANLDCHAKRVDVLVDRILDLGGKPQVEGGIWVGFTKTVEQAASLISSGTVVAALEQGEDIGLDNYKKALQKLDNESRTLVLRDLLPAQERTHKRMSAVKHAA